MKKSIKELTEAEKQGLRIEPNFYFMIEEVKELSEMRDSIEKRYSNLEGSSAQVKWAEKVRAQLTEKLMFWYTKNTNGSSSFFTEEECDKGFEIVSNWLSKPNVRVFIDFRDNMIAIMERRLAEARQNKA